jgi:uncharacterized protein
MSDSRLPPDWPSVDAAPPAGDGTLPTGLAIATAGQVLSYLIAGFVVLGLFYDATTKTRVEPGLWPIIAQFPALWIGLLGSVALVARRRSESIRSLTAFSVRFRDSRYLLLGVALQFIGGAAYSLVGKADESGQVAKDLMSNARNNTFGYFLLAALVGVGAPLVEETFYRGLVARAFVRQFGTVFGDRRRLVFGLSVFASGFWFAAIHFEPLQFPLLFVVGAVCAWLTLRVGRLGPGIFVHMGFNLISVIVLGLDLRNQAGVVWRF